MYSAGAQSTNTYILIGVPVPTRTSQEEGDGNHVGDPSTPVVLTLEEFLNPNKNVNKLISKMSNNSEEADKSTPDDDSDGRALGSPDSRSKVEILWSGATASKGFSSAPIPSHPRVHNQLAGAAIGQMGNSSHQSMLEGWKHAVPRLYKYPLHALEVVIYRKNGQVDRVNAGKKLAGINATGQEGTRHDVPDVDLQPKEMLSSRHAQGNEDNNSIRNPSDIDRKFGTTGIQDLNTCLKDERGVFSETNVIPAAPEANKKIMEVGEGDPNLRKVVTSEQKEVPIETAFRCANKEGYKTDNLEERVKTCNQNCKFVYGSRLSTYSLFQTLRERQRSSALDHFGIFNGVMSNFKPGSTCETSGMLADKAGDTSADGTMQSGRIAAIPQPEEGKIKLSQQDFGCVARPECTEQGSLTEVHSATIKMASTQTLVNQRSAEAQTRFVPNLATIGTQTLLQQTTSGSQTDEVNIKVASSVDHATQTSIEINNATCQTDKVSIRVASDVDVASQISTEMDNALCQTDEIAEPLGKPEVVTAVRVDGRPIAKARRRTSRRSVEAPPNHENLVKDMGLLSLLEAHGGNVEKAYRDNEKKSSEEDELDSLVLDIMQGFTDIQLSQGFLTDTLESVLGDVGEQLTELNQDLVAELDPDFDLDSDEDPDLSALIERFTREEALRTATAPTGPGVSIGLDQDQDGNLIPPTGLDESDSANMELEARNSLLAELDEHEPSGSPGELNVMSHLLSPFSNVIINSDNVQVLRASLYRRDN